MGGDHTSVGPGLSYQYLPAVLKALLEMTIRPALIHDEGFELIIGGS